MLSFDPAFALFQDYFAGLEHLGFSAALDKEKPSRSDGDEWVPTCRRELHALLSKREFDLRSCAR